MVDKYLRSDVLALEASTCRMILFRVLEKRSLSLVFNNYSIWHRVPHRWWCSLPLLRAKKRPLWTPWSPVDYMCMWSRITKILLHSSSSLASVSTFACLLVAPIPCCWGLLISESKEARNSLKSLCFGIDQFLASHSNKGASVLLWCVVGCLV